MDKKRHLKLGTWGEREAARYLMGKGYRILKRNVRKTWGELDIVAQAPDRTLVFVEVKTMRDKGPSYLMPEDHMSAGKLDRFRRAASLYAGSRRKLVPESQGWRLDVIALVVPYDWELPEPRGIVGRFLEFFRKPSITALRHYENVVRW